MDQKAADGLIRILKPLYLLLQLLALDHVSLSLGLDKNPTTAQHLCVGHAHSPTARLILEANQLELCLFGKGRQNQKTFLVSL